MLDDVAVGGPLRVDGVDVQTDLYDIWWGGAFADPLFQFHIETAQLILGVFAHRDVTHVALDHIVVISLVHVADKFYGKLATVPGLERQIFTEGISFLL